MKIYKYFSNKNFLERFINKGEVYFNSLTYFRICEDQARRDEHEGSNVFSGKGGHEITDVETGEKIFLKGSLLSQINTDNVFVYCTSTVFSEFLYKEFGAVGCVEIADAEIFKNKIRTKVRKLLSIKEKKILAGSVHYYDETEAPGSRYACPDDIVMSKLSKYRDEYEHRLAFTIKKGAWEVYNNSHSFVFEGFLNSPPTPVPVISSRILVLGDLSRIAKEVTL